MSEVRRWLAGLGLERFADAFEREQVTLDNLPELTELLSFGASPRASLALVAGARALALLRGRNYALPQDVTDLALDVLRHRIVLSYEALADNVTADSILTRVIAAIAVPDVPLREPRVTYDDAIFRPNA